MRRIGSVNRFFLLLYNAIFFSYQTNFEKPKIRNRTEYYRNYPLAVGWTGVLLIPMLCILPLIFYILTLHRPTKSYSNWALRQIKIHLHCGRNKNFKSILSGWGLQKSAIHCTTLSKLKAQTVTSTITFKTPTDKTPMSILYQKIYTKSQFQSHKILKFFR